MFKVFSQRLYLRIWLAVVGGVAVLTLVVGWAWRVAEEYNASNNAQQTNNARELVIRDGQGQILLQGTGQFFQVLGSREPQQDAKVLTAIIGRMEYQGLLDGAEPLSADEMLEILKRYMHLVLASV